jgi:hypothetical protein
MPNRAGSSLCFDGPLKGETHLRGPRFGFDGRQVGEERGEYVLDEGQYHWRVDPRARSVVWEQSSHQTTLFIKRRADGA